MSVTDETKVVRISRQLHDRVAECAAQERRTFRAQLELMLTQLLAARDDPATAYSRAIEAVPVESPAPYVVARAGAYEITADPDDFKPDPRFSWPKDEPDHFKPDPKS